MQLVCKERDRSFEVDKTGGRLVQKTRFGTVLGKVSFCSDCWRGVYELKSSMAAAHEAAGYATVRFA